MLIQVVLLGLFGLVITLVGLLLGFIGSVLLLFFRKGTKQDETIHERTLIDKQSSQKS